MGGPRSFEDEKSTTEYEPRTRHAYHCLLGHITTVVFHAEAVAPVEWDCSVCPAPARHEHQRDAVVEASGRPVPKTHYQQLLGRRTEAELEILLKQALRNLRKTGKAF